MQGTGKEIYVSIRPDDAFTRVSYESQRLPKGVSPTNEKGNGHVQWVHNGKPTSIDEEAILGWARETSYNTWDGFQGENQLGGCYNLLHVSKLASTTSHSEIMMGLTLDFSTSRPFAVRWTINFACIALTLASLLLMV